MEDPAPASPIPARIRIPSYSHSPSSPPRTPRTPKTPGTPTAPSTPTFLIPDISNPDNNFLRSPHQPSPRMHRTIARRLIADMEEGSGGDVHNSIINDDDPQFDTSPHNELLSTSEDIFVIPPMLSIDEKLFQDEVILWSHYVKVTTSLRQPQSIFNIIFFFTFFITTIVLAYSANEYISPRSAIVTLWLMAPILVFSGFLLARTVLEHTCFFITNFRIIQCKLLGSRVTEKSMSYPCITDIRLSTNAIGFFARHSYPFIKFIGVDNVNAVDKILQQQRENLSQASPLESANSLDTQNIPEKYNGFIHASDLPFLEVNHAPSIAGKYLKGTIKFVIIYVWLGVLLLLLKAGTGWMIPYFLSILLLPILFLLTNTLDKVDVLAAKNLIFLRVGIAYVNECRYGRNALRLGYESAYPLTSSYNIKTNQGAVSFYNYTFANVNSDDVIATEEIIFHKYMDALRD